MNMKNHYKEKFWDYDKDQLKDIVAGRFKEPSDDEVAAAMELIRERNEQNTSMNSGLSLAQIPSASMAVLLEIVKNPATWGTDAVEIAEAEILRREHQPLEKNSTEKGKKTILQLFLAIIGLVISILLLKLVAAIFIICFFFYCVMSCLGNM